MKTEDKKDVLYLEEMRSMAALNGGVCLSKKYVNARTHLLWRCEKGHTWEAVPSTIKQGSWCPVCSGRKKGTIEEMFQIAKDHGGKCLSKEYINSSTHLLWQCKEGHIWEAVPNEIKQGSWCPVCAKESRKGNIEELQKIAQSKGGKCLSKKYINNHTHLNWECENGHKWKATPHGIKAGKWCSKCSGNVKGTIEEMQSLAQVKGGKCLSKVYINNSTHLLWRCEKGHKWEAIPNDIKQGSWCPVCAKDWSRGTIEQMQEIAYSKGGRCLSQKYVDRETHLQWQCENGHKWDSSPTTIIKGSWCPECYVDSRRKTIQEMQELSLVKNGKCLSKQYINNYTKLLWQCENGHKWKAVPTVIMRGSWCPYCVK